MWPKGLSGSPKCNDSMHNRLHTVVKQLHVLKHMKTTYSLRHINYSSCSEDFVWLGTNIYSSNKKFVVKRLTWLFILPWNSSFIFYTDIIKYMQFIYKKKLTPWWIQRSSVVLRATNLNRSGLKPMRCELHLILRPCSLQSDLRKRMITSRHWIPDHG